MVVAVSVAVGVAVGLGVSVGGGDAVSVAWREGVHVNVGEASFAVGCTVTPGETSVAAVWAVVGSALTCAACGRAQAHSSSMTRTTRPFFKRV